jgi:hypothetical protein
MLPPLTMQRLPPTLGNGGSHPCEVRVFSLEGFSGQAYVIIGCGPGAPRSHSRFARSPTVARAPPRLSVSRGVRCLRGRDVKESPA